MATLCTYPNSLVTDAKNGFTIGADDEINIATLCLLKIVFLHGFLVLKGKIQTLSLPEQMRIIRDRVSLQHLRIRSSGRYSRAGHIPPWVCI